MLLTAVALVLGTPLSTAQAAPFGLDCIGVPDMGNVGPEFYASASSVLLPSAQPEYGPEPDAAMDKTTLAKNYTLYELTNGRGLLWSTFKEDAEGEEQCAIMDVAGNWMAQQMFEFAKSLGSFSLAIQDLAQNNAPFQELYQGKDGVANSLVTKLYSTLWAPLGVFMVTLCGMWVLAQGGTKNRQKVWKGVAGMVVSLGISGLLLQGSWYTTVTSEADKMINGLTSAMTEVLLPENAGDKQADPCWLAEGVPNRAKRVSSCQMYKAMMFTPWAAGQFGQNANLIIDSGWEGSADGGWSVNDCSLGYRCTDIRTAQVMAQTFTRADSGVSLLKKIKNLENVAEQMAEDDRKTRFNDWRGANPSSRMQVAIAAGVSNLILAPSIDFAALFKLFWEGFILLLIIVLPIVGAVAAFPPATFMIREWGNTFTIAFVLKGVAWFALTLLLAIYSMILSSDASLGVQVLMIILVGFGLLHLTRKTMQGAKKSADQAFEAQNMYNEVTGRAGGFAKRQAMAAGRRGLNQLTGNRTPSPKRSRGPKGPGGSLPTQGPPKPKPNKPGTGGQKPAGGDKQNGKPSTPNPKPDPSAPPKGTGKPNAGDAGSSAKDGGKAAAIPPEASSPKSPSDTPGDVVTDPSASGRPPTPAVDKGTPPDAAAEPEGSSTPRAGMSRGVGSPSRVPTPRSRAGRPEEGSEPANGSAGRPAMSEDLPAPRARRPRPAPDSGDLPRRPNSPRLPPAAED